MFCPHCGKSIADIAKFCPYCGANLATNVDSQSKEQNDENTPTNLEYLSNYAPHNSSANVENGITSRLIRIGIVLLGGGLAFVIIWGIISNALQGTKEISEINPLQNNEDLYQASRVIDPTEFDGVFANLDNENELLEIEWADWSLIFSCYTNDEVYFETIILTPYVSDTENGTQSTVSGNKLVISPTNIDADGNGNYLHFNYNIELYYVPAEDSPYNVDTIYMQSEDFKNATYIRIEDAYIPGSDEGYDDEHTNDQTSKVSLFQLKRTAETNTQTYLSIDTLVRNPYSFIDGNIYRFSGEITYIERNLDETRGLLLTKDSSTCLGFYYPGWLEAIVGDEVILWGTVDGLITYINNDGLEIQTANIYADAFRVGRGTIEAVFSEEEWEFIFDDYYTEDATTEIEKNISLTADTINGRPYTVVGCGYNAATLYYNNNQGGESLVLAMETEAIDTGEIERITFIFSYDGTVSVGGTRWYESVLTTYLYTYYRYP